MTEFFIDCIPPKTTAQSSSRVFKNKYTGKMFIGKTDKGKTTREELIGLLHPYKPEKPIQGALKLKISWIYPYLKTIRKKDVGKIIPCPTRPDCDNICKFLCDCMTRCGFWLDDSQIYSLEFTKCYYEKPGIFISIEKNIKKNEKVVDNVFLL